MSRVYPTGLSCILMCGLWTTGGFAAPGRVCTTGAWAAPGLTYIDYRSLCCSWTTKACDLYVPTLQGPELHLDLSVNYIGLCCSWICLHHGAIATSGHVWTTGVFAAADGSTLQGPELHLDMSEQHQLVLVLTCLHHMGLSWTWTCLYCRGLWCIWTCLHHRGQSFI